MTPLPLPSFSRSPADTAARRHRAVPFFRVRPPIRGCSLPFGLRLLLLVAFLLAGCAASGSRRAESRDGLELRIRGSDTMAPLARRWAEEFMRSHPGVSVSAEGGGTRAGIDALIAGDIDLCTASRTLTADESRRLVERRGSLGICILTARDAVSIYLNHDNPVRRLTTEQLRGLFAGTIVSWSEVGGRDEPVRLYIREPASGTRAFIRDHVLEGGPFAPAATVCSGTWAVATAVAADRWGVGFGGIAFGQQVHHVEIDGVAPTPAHVRDGTYPLSRYLYLYTVEQPTGLLKTFVDFVLSPAGQTIVEEVEYIPLWEMEETP